MDALSQYWFNALTSANFAVCTMCMLANSLVVYVSAKHKSLHSTSTFLIATNSLLDAGQSLLWVALFTWLQLAQQQWPLRLCLGFSLPALSCFVGSYFAVFLISFDRLLSVIAPFWHRTLNSAVYFGFMFLLGVLYIFAMMQFPYRNVANTLAATPNAYYALILTHPTLSMCGLLPLDSSVVCQPPSTLGPLGNQFHLACLAFNAFTAGCYWLLWALLKYTKNRPDQANNRRLFRSLVAITCVVLSGWMLNAISKLAGPLFVPNSLAQIVFAKSFQVLFNITQTCNVFVLYSCSSRYKRAIQSELSTWPWIGAIFADQGNVISQGNVVTNVVAPARSNANISTIT